MPTPNLFPAATLPLTGTEIIGLQQAGIVRQAPLNAISALFSGLAQAGIVLSKQPNIDKTGLTDSYAGFVAAYTLAMSQGIPLIIDCKCYISILTNDSKSIFLRTGTMFFGTPSGEITLDNSFIPSFIMHHTTDAMVLNLNIKYIGTPPWDTTIGPYPALPAHFNDVIMKNDLITNFGNTFTGSGSALFQGTITPQSIFLLRGACQRILFQNVRFYVPQGANASNFIGCVMGLDPEWLPGTLVTNNNQPQNSTTAIIPSDIDMIDCRIDGALMGILGCGGIRINGLKSWRYSDMQKPDGTGAGGNGLSFAPPHLIYLQDQDPSYSNWQRDICNVYDYGQYVGGAIRRPATTSGTSLSLKLAPCKNTVVNNYTSLRPDGFADILTNTYGNAFGAMSNLYFTYDSSLVTANGSSVWGMRFPSLTPYNYLTINNVTARDVNPSPKQFPFLDIGNILNTNIRFSGVKVYLADWNNTLYPGFGMSGNHLSLDADYFFAQYSDDTNLRGSFCNQGSELGTNCNVDIRVHGFRLFPVVFSTAPTLNTPLATNWTHQSGTYLVQFSDNEVRFVVLANGNTTATWTGTLAGQPTTGASGTGTVATITFSNAGQVAAIGSTVTIAGVTPAGYNGTWTVSASAPGSVSFASLTTGAQSVAGTISNFVNATAQNAVMNNYNGYKQRMLHMQAGKGIGNRIRILDVTNGMEMVAHNGVVQESWTISWSGTPAAGLTYDLPIVIPATHNPDLASAFVQAALGTSGGLTSFALGWAATPGALLTGVSPAINTNPATPYSGPVTVNAGTSRTLRLTATGGTGFDGTGNVLISVRLLSCVGAT